MGAARARHPGLALHTCTDLKQKTSDSVLVVYGPLLPSQQCGGAVPLSTFLFLDKFCEDCYNLYRIAEIYTECKADCFRNEYFDFCLNVTLVDDDTKDKAGEDILVISFIDLDTFSEPPGSNRWRTVSRGGDTLLILYG